MVKYQTFALNVSYPLISTGIHQPLRLYPCSWGNMTYKYHLLCHRSFTSRTVAHAPVANCLAQKNIASCATDTQIPSPSDPGPPPPPISALFPNERYLSVFILQLLFLKNSPSSAAHCLSGFFDSHHNWKEVGGCVLPACFLPSQRLPVDTQTHKHLPLLVPPFGRCIRVVAVLLDPLLQGAVSAKVSLDEKNVRRFSVEVKTEHCRVLDDKCTSQTPNSTCDFVLHSFRIFHYLSGSSRLTFDPDTHRTVQLSLPADSQIVVAVQAFDGDHSHVHRCDFQNT